MNFHISTAKTFRAGIDLPPFECFICGKETMFHDWVGCRCDTCGADTAWESDLAGFVRTIREKTKLSRKEIAKKAGIKPSTIKNYEWCIPSKKYFEWFKVFIKDFYREKS